MASDTSSSRRTWVGITLSLLCLGAILFFINPAKIFRALQMVHWLDVVRMVAGLLLFLLIRAVRWQFMLTEGTPLRSVFHVQNVGYLFNMTLPFRLGDVARAVLIANVPPATVAGGLSTMVVERLLDMLFVVTLLPFTLTAVTALPEWMQAGARFFGYASIAGIGMMVLAANQQRFALKITQTIFDRIPNIDSTVWNGRVANFFSGLSSLTTFKGAAILLLLSVLVWLPVLYTYDVGMRTFGIEPTPLQVGFLFCAAALSVAAPSAPGQIGLFHASVIGAMVAMGFADETAAALAFAYHAINLITMVVMGFIGLTRLGTTYENVVNSARGFMQGGRKEMAQK